MSYLMAGLETSIKRAAIHVKADIPIGEEYGRNLAFLSKLSEISPVLETILSLAVVIC